MTDDLTLNMDAYLPLRDVVFNTLREAILNRESGLWSYSWQQSLG